MVVQQTMTTPPSSPTASTTALRHRLHLQDSVVLLVLVLVLEPVHAGRAESRANDQSEHLLSPFHTRRRVRDAPSTGLMVTRFKSGSQQRPLRSRAEVAGKPTACPAAT